VPVLPPVADKYGNVALPDAVKGADLAVFEASGLRAFCGLDYGDQAADAGLVRDFRS